MHSVGGWFGHRTGPDDVEKRKILFLPGTELRPSAVQPIARNSVFKELKIF
jgi:hypothetical protein